MDGPGTLSQREPKKAKERLGQSIPRSDWLHLDFPLISLFLPPGLFRFFEGFLFLFVFSFNPPLRLRVSWILIIERVKAKHPPGTPLSRVWPPIAPVA